MGTYTTGRFEAGLSRPLTPGELGAWVELVRSFKDRRQEQRRKYRTQADGPYTGPERRAEGYGNRRAWSEVFDPETWNVNAEEPVWGDVGTLELSADGFTIEADGKVYDIEEALRVTVELLPEGVEAEGEGSFESDGELWAMRAHGRETKACAAWVTIAPWDDPRGEAVA